MVVVSEEQTHEVIKALENPKYEWRTNSGIAKDTGLDPEVVLQAISELADQVVRSSILSTDGRELFTTRSHFRKKSSFPERFLVAMRGRL